MCVCVRVSVEHGQRLFQNLHLITYLNLNVLSPHLGRQRGVYVIWLNLPSLGPGHLWQIFGSLSHTI